MTEATLHPVDQIAAAAEAIEQLEEARAKLESVQEKLKENKLTELGPLQVAIKNLKQSVEILQTTPERLAKPLTGEQQAQVIYSRSAPEPWSPRCYDDCNLDLVKHYLGISDVDLIQYVAAWLSQKPAATLFRIENAIVDVVVRRNNGAVATGCGSGYWNGWEDRPQCRMAREIINSEVPLHRLSLNQLKILYWAKGNTWAELHMRGVEIYILGDRSGFEERVEPSNLSMDERQFLNISRVRIHDYLQQWAARHFMSETHRCRPD